MPAWDSRAFSLICCRSSSRRLSRLTSLRRMPRGDFPAQRIYPALEGPAADWQNTAGGVVYGRSAAQWTAMFKTKLPIVVSGLPRPTRQRQPRSSRAEACYPAKCASCHTASGAIGERLPSCPSKTRSIGRHLPRIRRLQGGSYWYFSDN